MIIPLLITAVVFLINLWRPKLGVAAIIILWPAYLLRTSIFQIPTTALELSLYAVALATVILWSIKHISWHWIQMTKWTWWLLGLWVAAWLVATIFSPNQQAALGALKAWLFDPLLFCALLIFHIRTGTDRRSIIQAAIISGTIVAVFGLYQMIWLGETLQAGRLSSFFHPVANYAAMYLAPLFILNIGLLWAGYVRARIWWLTAGSMFMALILTMSYGGWLAVAAGSVVLWHYCLSGRQKIRLAVVGLAVAGVATLVLSTTSNFAEHFLNPERSSGQVRKEIWVTAWALIQQQPLLGIGPNNFEAAYRAEIPKHYFPPLEWLVAKPHDLYIALWLELGLLGLLVFITHAIRHVIGLRQHIFSNHAEKAVTVACLAAWVAIVVHGFVDTPYFKNDLAMEYMFLVLLPWLGRQKKF